MKKKRSCGSGNRVYKALHKLSDKELIREGIERILPFWGNEIICRECHIIGE